MTSNREPTADELNGVKQDTIHWPAKAKRVTNVDSDGEEITTDNPLPVSLASDVEIGAVEIKDGTTDTRAKVKTDGTDNAQVVTSNALKVKDIITGDPVELTSAPLGGEGSDALQVFSADNNEQLELLRNDIDTIKDTQTDGNQKTQITDGTDDADVVENVDDDTDLEDTKGLVTNSILYARLSDGIIKPLRMDAATHSIQTISYPHHEIHAGSSYVCRDVIDLSVGDFWDIQITTPAGTKWAHMTFEFDVESETEFWVYMNVTINVAGDALTCGNRNLNVDNPTTLVIKGIENTSEANANADTAVAGATLLAHGIIGSGRQEGGMSASRQEVILKASEDFTVRFKANSAGYVNYHLDWYEHTSKN